MDNNRRYVSPRVRRKPFARASASISPGQFFQKEVSLPTLVTYRRFMSTKGVFREEGVAFTCLNPIKKGETAPHQLSSCSFSPLLWPRSSARLLIYPSACSASSRFRLALSAQSSSPLLRTPSALAPSPRVLGSSRPRPAYDSFGSSQRSPFYHAPAPFRTLAFSAPLSRLSFPLLRLPRARFSALPLHIP